MTDISLAAPSFAEREFRVGSAMSKTIKVLSRNALTFGIVTGVANLPTVLLMRVYRVMNSYDLVIRIGGLALSDVLLVAPSQAILLYAAFDDLRGRSIDLVASFGHAWRRFLPVIGAAFFMTLLGGLASLLLVVPGLILLTMWYVAIPVCVVEQFGPLESLRRSAALTKGHRWKIFGMVVVLIIISTVGRRQ
jgi:uncharacterized membrane protein